MPPRPSFLRKRGAASVGVRARGKEEMFLRLAWTVVRTRPWADPRTLRAICDPEKTRRGTCNGWHSNIYQVLYSRRAWVREHPPAKVGSISLGGLHGSCMAEDWMPSGGSCGVRMPGWDYSYHGDGRCYAGEGGLIFVLCVKGWGVRGGGCKMWGNRHKYLQFEGKKRGVRTVESVLLIWSRRGTDIYLLTVVPNPNPGTIESAEIRVRRHPSASFPLPCRLNQFDSLGTRFGF